MRKIIVYLLCCSMIFGLCACGGQAYKNDDRSFTRVINASAEELYGIGYTYYVDGKVICSGGGCYADNSAIKVGDVLSLENQSFGEDVENVEIELSVVSESGKEYPCDTKIALDPNNQTACDIEITGDYEHGFCVAIVGLE